MALSVTPGYDFGVNETPRKKTLDRWLRNLKISGVDLDVIDPAVSLNLFVRGTTSGITGASLARSWLWGDPNGVLWFETARGACKLYRADGGWETNRYLFINQDATFRPGIAANFDTSSRGTHTTLRAEDDFLATSSGDMNYFVTQDSNQSGDTGVRLVGRGGTIIYQTEANFGLFNFADRYCVMRVDSAAAGAFDLRFHNTASDFLKRAWTGIGFGFYPGASQVGSPFRWKAKIYGYHNTPLAIFGPGSVY